ncbi:MAG TPA: GNAT family N-acetyltransferase [Devosia sp.]|nr:GNAT family N-acetyltransferase [Devosia sp.]
MEVTLATRRLVLRQPRPDDAGAMATYLNNFRVAGCLSRVPYPYREADAVGWLKAWRPGSPPGETGFMLELPGSGAIGHAGFHPDSRGTVVGYWLGEPFWNRGFMTEALKAILGWYFETTQAVVIASGVFAFNGASLAVQRKLGFTETGTSFRHCLARKQQVRHIDTELTRARWAERAAREDAVP